MRRFRVVIAQEYVPEYRVPFFKLLMEVAARQSVEIVIAAGTASGERRLRSDGAVLDWVVPIKQREFKLCRRRVVFRRMSSVVRDADMVVKEQARRNLDFYRLLLPRMFRRRKVALWGHGRDYSNRTAARFDRRLISFITSRCDWFFAYTEQGAEQLLQQGFDARRLTVVDNAIDSSRLCRSIEAVDAEVLGDLETEFELRDHTALFMGGLDSSKRIHFLIKSCRIVASRDPRFKLIIAGDGADREEVIRASIELNWLEYVGVINGDRKALFLRAANVIAMPGSVGLIAVDSFASGVPIVTTTWAYHGPEFDYLVDDENAAISDNSEDAYAEKLYALLTSPEKQVALSRACLEASKKYTIENMVSNFFDGILVALKF